MAATKSSKTDSKLPDALKSFTLEVYDELLDMLNKTGTRRSPAEGRDKFTKALQFSMLLQKSVASVFTSSPVLMKGYDNLFRIKT